MLNMNFNFTPQSNIISVKLFILQTSDNVLRVCYGDFDSKKYKVCRPNVRPENVDGEQVRNVEHVAKDEALLTDLK